MSEEIFVIDLTVEECNHMLYRFRPMSGYFWNGNKVKKDVYKGLLKGYERHLYPYRVYGENVGRAGYKHFGIDVNSEEFKFLSDYYEKRYIESPDYTEYNPHYNTRITKVKV